MRWRPERWALVLLSAVILVASIGWGLPSSERVDVLLSGEAPTARQWELLTTLRQEFYRSGDREHPPEAELDERERIEAFRAFLVGSAAVDERKPYSALSRMDPARLDLDPRIYLYGGSFLYPIGALIVAADATGWLTIHREIGRYLEHPEDAARLYLLGRSLGVASYMGVLLLLGPLGDRLGGRVAGSMAMAAWAFCTLALNQAVVTKPHVFAAFWTLLAIFLALREVSTRRRALLAGAAAGMAAGASLPAGLLVLFLPVLWLGGEQRRALTRAMLVFWSAAGAVFLLTNPALPFVADAFIAEVVGIGSSDGWGYAQASWAKAPAYLWDLIHAAYPFPLSLVAFVAAVRSLFAGSGPSRRLAALLLVQIGVIAFTLANARISLFVGPQLCLFAGLGAAWAWAAVRRFGGGGRLALLLVLCLPGLLFTLLFARDTATETEWSSQTRAWISEVGAPARASFGIFPPLHPVKTPPFPFLEARVVRLDRVTSLAAAPEWVVISSHAEDRRDWAVHPLRREYDLARVVGSRPWGDWAASWRPRNEANREVWIYRRRAVSSRLW